MAAIDLEHFRDNVRYLIGLLGWGGQRKVAEDAGISKEYLSDVLRGIKSPSLVVAWDIARAVNRTLDELSLPPKKFSKIFKKAG